MSRSWKNAVAFALVLMLTASITLAGQKIKDQDKGRGRAKEASSVHKKGETDTRVAVDIFLGNDRDLIRNHFGANRSNLPPGLARRGSNLPPGLEKQLHRNGQLPPGLDKRIDPFPIELERRLPPLKPGLIRGIIGGSAVIMNAKTRVILDAFAIL